MRGKGYILYSIITTLLQEAAAAGIVLWLLPMLDVHIPLWGLGIIMTAVGAWGFIGYWLSKDVVNREEHTPSSAMIGCAGKATTPIDPEGVVRIRGELWKARSSSGIIDKGEDIVIVGIEGLILSVAPLLDRVEE